MSWTAERLYAAYRDESITGKRLERLVRRVWSDDHQMLPILGAERVRELFRAIGTPMLTERVTLFRGVREDSPDYGWSYTDSFRAAETYATLSGSFGEVITVTIQPEHILAVIPRSDHREFVADGEALELSAAPVVLVSTHHSGITSDGTRNPLRLGASLFGALG